MANQNLFDFTLFDQEFDDAHKQVLVCSADPTAPITDAVELAADRMFDIAIQLGDQLMLAFCFARFDDFMRQGRTPPRTMLEHVNEAGRRFRSGDKSLDAAFGLKHPRRGRPPSWLGRQIGRTVACVIASYLHDGIATNETDATARAEEFFRRSDLRRTWRKYRK